MACGVLLVRRVSPRLRVPAGSSSASRSPARAGPPPSGEGDRPIRGYRRRREVETKQHCEQGGSCHDRSQPGWRSSSAAAESRCSPRTSASRAGSGAGPPGCAARRSRRCATCRPTTTPAWSGSAGRSRPSQMIASIAQGLHLSLDERDHLFRLAGHNPPARGASQRAHQPRPAAHPRPPQRHPRRDRHRARRDAAADPARRRAHRRHDPVHRACPQHRSTGGSPTRPPASSTPPKSTRSSPAMFASGLREIATLRGPGLPGRAPRRSAPRRRARSSARVWDEHEIGIRPHDVKRFIHPEVGALELTCQTTARPRPVALASRLHRHSRQREPRQAEPPVRHRNAGAPLTAPPAPSPRAVRRRGPRSFSRCSQRRSPTPFTPARAGGTPRRTGRAGAGSPTPRSARCPTPARRREAGCRR